MNILVTGGAGFVGSTLVDALIKKGHAVRVFDNLDSQVHGLSGKKPAHLNRDAEFIKADVCNRDMLKKSLQGIEVVFHQAARVGVGQSMYEVSRYVESNSLGTAILLDILVNERHKVKKLIVASSMSIYGEGKYKCPNCGIVFPELRTKEQVKQREWEMKCNRCQKKRLSPLPTDEQKPLLPTSIYAITKKDQEQMCLTIGRAYKIPTVALRYFNIYGPRQALSNPYTGVAAIFSCRLLNNHSPMIFEDGGQSRDFVHVNDIVAANILAMEKKEADYENFNVGTGRAISILQLTRLLVERLNPKLKPIIVNKFREGDIRHCYADISKIGKMLGFKPKVKFESGIGDLINWVKTQSPRDLSEKMKNELNTKGLIR